MQTKDYGKKKKLNITLYFLNQSIVCTVVWTSHTLQDTSKHAWSSQQMMSCMSMSVTRWPIPDVSGQLKYAWGLTTFYCRSLFLSIHSHLCEDCDNHRRLKVIEAICVRFTINMYFIVTAIAVHLATNWLAL